MTNSVAEKVTCCRWTFGGIRLVNPLDMVNYVLVEENEAETERSVAQRNHKIVFRSKASHIVEQTCRAVQSVVYLIGS